jgi:hypothetical protein
MQLMRTWLNDQANEDNGFFRLSQCCARCAYFSLDESKEDESPSSTCQRHNKDVTPQESLSFTCDFFA